MEPDIILLPGDIIDDHPGVFIQKNMGHIMKQMTAPLGVYGVLEITNITDEQFQNFYKRWIRSIFVFC